MFHKTKINTVVLNSMTENKEHMKCIVVPGAGYIVFENNVLKSKEKVERIFNKILNEYS